MSGLINYTIKIKDVEKPLTYAFTRSHEYILEFDKNGKFILMLKGENENILLVLCDYDKIEYCYYSNEYDLENNDQREVDYGSICKNDR